MRRERSAARNYERQSCPIIVGVPITEFNRKDTEARKNPKNQWPNAKIRTGGSIRLTRSREGHEERRPVRLRALRGFA
jgi:hypothetical protein